MARGPVYKDRERVKDAVLRVRVTQSTLAELQKLADERRVTISEVTRARLGLDNGELAAAQPAHAGA